jgi:hypothetical protein
MNTKKNYFVVWFRLLPTWLMFAIYGELKQPSLTGLMGWRPISHAAQEIGRRAIQ